MNFYIPPNMVQNYDAFLQTEVCHSIKYCRDFLAEEQVWIDERVEISPINYKSKQYGSDNGIRMRFSKNSLIQKGDIVDYNGKLYIISWQINEDKLDSRSCIAEMLAAPITFKRFFPAEVDNKTADILTPDEYRDLFTIRCMNITNGNYEVRLKNSQVGLFPSNKSTISLQANPSTFTLKRGDMYKLYGETHVIRDIRHTELNYDGQTGLLILHSENSSLGVDL